MIGNDAFKRRLRSSRSILLLVCFLIICEGCKKKIDNGYHVVAYNGASKEWTVIDKDFDRSLDTYHRKRFVLACDSYEYNRGGFEHGPDACELHVGDIFETDLGERPGHHVFVDPSEKNAGTGEVEFYLARDEGENHEVQFFRIVKEEVLPDEK